MASKTLHAFFHVSPGHFPSAAPLGSIPYEARKLVGSSTVKQAMTQAMHLAQGIAAAGHSVEVRETTDRKFGLTGPTRLLCTVGQDGSPVTLWVEF